MKFVVLVLFASILCASSFAADSSDTIFKLSGWTYGRERKTLTGSNRVTASVTIKNASKTAVSEVTATLTYSTGLGEKIGAPIVQKIGALKPGESKTATFIQEFVPAFQGYGIAIQFNGNKKEEWFGNSDTAQPDVKSAQIKGEANVVILGKEATVDKNGVFSGTLHLKNEGTEEAKNLKIFVTFFDFRKNKIKDWNGTLGSGTLVGGADQNIPFTMPNAPKVYGSYSIRLNNDDAPPEAALAGGDFTSVEDVEFAHFKFTHADAGSSSYKVECQCRNGLKYAAEHVKLEMIFYGPRKREVKRFSDEVPGTVAAGEIKDVVFNISGLPAYEEYEQRISYGKSAAAPKAPAQNGALKFKNKPEVEVVFGIPSVNGDNVLELKGAVRNGKETPVKDVIIHIVFNKPGGGTTLADRTLPSSLKPGEEKEFFVYSEKAVGAVDFKFAFTFSDVNEGKADDKKDGAKKTEQDALHQAL